jgi:hypothetical protein
VALLDETVLDLTAAAKIVPPAKGRRSDNGPEDSPTPRGKKTHVSTILRWILSGAKAPDGTRVRLEALRLGGRWVTSREALQRFAEALTPRPAGEPAPAPRSPTARRRDSERAAKKLDVIGF